METQLLHRGRLIDHIQLVVADLKASRAFYEAIFDVLKMPIGGEAEDYFWVDELFVSSKDSAAATGELTGRHHLAFQAADRAMVDAFYAAGLARRAMVGAAGRAALSSRLLLPSGSSRKAA
jgi:catechol 2,3-dioxygenase-like lactoylglutathione lyase family enzyme